MYTVASPNPNPRGGGQLPNPNKCNFTLTSGIRGETLTPNPNLCNSTPTSGSSGGAAPTYIIYQGSGSTIYSNECHSTLTSTTRGEMLTPYPDECNSAPRSETGGIFPTHIYIYIHIYICKFVKSYPGLIRKSLQSAGTIIDRGVSK